MSTAKKNQPRAKSLKHPMQPIGYDDQGILRFKRNAIVEALLSEGVDMNVIMRRVLEGTYTREDYTQFVQLIGYSVSGTGDLSSFDRKVRKAADEEVSRILGERK